MLIYTHGAFPVCTKNATLGEANGAQNSNRTNKQTNQPNAYNWEQSFG